MDLETVSGKNISVGNKIVLLEDRNREEAQLVVFEVVDVTKTHIATQIISGDNEWFKFTVDSDGLIRFKISDDSPFHRIKPSISEFLSFDFILRNAVGFGLVACLYFFYDAKPDWRFFVTVLIMGFCSGISEGYNNRKKNN